MPGGFAGFYLDSVGHLVVALTDVTQRDEAMNRLGEALRLHTGDRFAEAVSNVRFQHAEYRFDQLQDWRQKFFNTQLEGLVVVDVDEVSNRIVLGFDRLEGVEDQLQRVLANYVIPPNAVRAVTAERIQPTQSLDDLFSSIPGGVSVRYPGAGMCTIAAAMRYNGVDAILTAAHCSGAMGAIDPGQWLHASTLGFIGWELADPPTICPPLRCRRSDATIVSTNGYPIELGQIARTSFVGWYPPGSAGSTTIDAAKPRFPILFPGYATSYPINGERVHRVGRVTGWVSGPVNQTCLDRQDEGWWRICQYRYNSGTIGGDSGGSVFNAIPCADDPPTISNCAVLAGIHWGGNSTQSYFSPILGFFQDFAPFSFQFIP